MKKGLLSLISSVAVLLTNAQTDVYLQIHHMLGDAPFAYEATASTNLSEDFQVTRLEYYLSEITLIHDGGQETTIPDLWLLVDAGETVNAFLGSHDITTLESVRFGVGVDQEHNHLDPSAYPGDHPLAPQLPSMHWGWASGYRFVAMEGWAGEGFAQNFQIHALGDINYRTTEIATSGAILDGSLVVAIEGDYAQAIRDISVAAGVISHGETEQSAELLWNFHDFVFKEGEASVVSSLDNPGAASIVVAPNPAGSIVQIRIPGQMTSGNNIALTDYSGRQIMQVPAESQVTLDVSDLPARLYLVQLISTNGTLAWKKLYIN